MGLRSIQSRAAMDLIEERRRDGEEREAALGVEIGRGRSVGPTRTGVCRSCPVPPHHF